MLLCVFCVCFAFCCVFCVLFVSVCVLLVFGSFGHVMLAGQNGKEQKRCLFGRMNQEVNSTVESSANHQFFWIHPTVETHNRATGIRWPQLHVRHAKVKLDSPFVMAAGILGQTEPYFSEYAWCSIVRKKSAQDSKKVTNRFAQPDMSILMTSGAEFEYWAC